MIRTTISFNFVIYDIPYSVDYFMRIEGDHIFFTGRDNVFFFLKKKMIIITEEFKEESFIAAKGVKAVSRLGSITIATLRYYLLTGNANDSRTSKFCFLYHRHLYI